MGPEEEEPGERQLLAAHPQAEEAVGAAVGAAAAAASAGCQTPLHGALEIVM